MKHEKKLSCLIGAVLAFVIALAGIGCMDSAFGLNADMQLLSAYLILWAILCGVSFYFRRGGTVFLCICAILTGYLLREGTLEQEVESLLFHLTRFYDGGYGWGIIYWTTTDLTEVVVDGGLFVIGATVLSIVALVLCRRKNEIPAMLAAIVPLGLCLVVTDTIPSEPWLFLLIASLALLLLTHPVRKKRAFDGIRLSALLLVPVFLASMLLFVLSPQDSYVERLDGLRQFFSTHFNGEPSDILPPADGPGTASPKDKVDLSAIGKRENMSGTVMQVLAEGTQTLYLRGQSYDLYDGLSWVASDIGTGIDPYWPTEGLVNIGHVSVHTTIKQDYMLLPYYIAAENWNYVFKTGMYPNVGEYQYNFYQKVLMPDSRGLAAAVDYGAAALQPYLELPSQTAAAWKSILEQANIPQNTDPATAAERIAEFVRNSAGYDLNTDKMPQDASDFGIWFLTEGDTGYCVHFATAATLLLRTQGIPARYVTGYATEVQRGIRKTVTENEAHAWVEYLHPQLGWQILEATPGFEVFTPIPSEDEQPTEPTDSTPTEPPKETEPTDPTPTEPTIPTNPTVPAETEPPEVTLPGDTEETIEPGQPGLVGNGEGNGGVDWQKIRPMIFRILCVILAIVLAIGQRSVRIRCREKRMHRGNANQQALMRWKFVLRLKRLLRQKMPEQLHELAQKAAYSQHILTAQELEQFDVWLDAAKKELQAKPWYLRLVYKWILAVI